MYTNQTRDVDRTGVDHQSLLSLSQRFTAGNSSSMAGRHRRDKSPNAARLEALKLQMQIQGTEEDVQQVYHTETATEDGDDTIQERVRTIR